MDDCSEVDDADTAVTTVEGPVIVLKFSFNKLFSRVTKGPFESPLDWSFHGGQRSFQSIKVRWYIKECKMVESVLMDPE